MVCACASSGGDSRPGNAVQAGWLAGQLGLIREQTVGAHDRHDQRYCSLAAPSPSLADFSHVSGIVLPGHVEEFTSATDDPRARFVTHPTRIMETKVGAYPLCHRLVGMVGWIQRFGLKQATPTPSAACRLD